MKKYDYHSIKKINKKGILFDDDFFLDFELSRINWAKTHNVLVDDERDIIGTNQRKPSKIKGLQMI